MMKHTSPLFDSAPSRYVSCKRCQFGRGLKRNWRTSNASKNSANNLCSAGR